MDTETAQQVLGIASSLTTNAVLMLWLYREMKRSDNYQKRLEMLSDREREENRLRNEPVKGA